MVYDARVYDPAERLVVAMSGGVDSSVVAWMLREAGHELVGLFMRNGVKVPEGEASKKSCCSASDARDARMVAGGLGIPFQAVDLKRDFAEIIDYFVQSYRRGRTPNPCAVCNRDLKFDRLLELADELGAAGVATGHYARLAIVDGRVHLRRGVDRKKDQSYQLFAVSEAHLARTRLPLGDLEKPAVRDLAARAGLRTAAKRDSQEICFVPSNDYRKLLAEKGVELTPGVIVDTAGRVLREHDGIENFTIGQRRGHGVGGSVEALYVVELIAATGTVVLGGAEECRSTQMVVEDVNLIGIDRPADGVLHADVQIRYHHGGTPARIEFEADRAVVTFDDPPMAVTPGQGAAFYLGDRLVGGGWIESATRWEGSQVGEVAAADAARTGPSAASQTAASQTAASQTAASQTAERAR
ncbi:MnmA/TRMU family protein [Engelhardtia mirabilis]|uniref:tRNA-specific 2-thiouridylase MnmA n=1 Tax=Engelhardtia mirabilis TaxID=2528011 RepID=A0A518BJQ2_9BACT|nr:tRNA-specific 2-thiouridylase MnmA [Planctomycetes bacterium Pla133]QDV01490.1 tRNA-specific 2-thiouridylase MnmA [Planctomycetes bacterium Pla86]